MSVVRRALLTDKRVDGQCEHRVEQARRFLSESRFQSPQTGGGDHKMPKKKKAAKKKH